MVGVKLLLVNIMVAYTVLNLMITVAQDDPQTLELGHGCSPNTYRYVNQTAFNDNLKTAFASLASDISSSNASFFATSFSSKGATDQVYALLLCRKYLTSTECQQCFAAAEKGVQQYCSDPGFNGGRIILDGCFLRYENTTFFQQSTDSGFSNYCASVYDTKPREFNQTAQMLLSSLTVNASAGDGYAVGFASVGSTTVYGLAQCVPTLSRATCQECLKEGESLVENDCLPMQQGRAMESGCFMRYANYRFYGGNSTTPNSPSTSSKRKIWPILLGSIGGAALLAALCSVFICRRFFRRFKRIRSRHHYTEAEEDLDLATVETFEQVVFQYDVLRDATENFDKANLIGRGGFGEVYKGRLVDGTAIAVKLSESRSSKAMEDFLREVKLISSVRHRNLVRLLGCCARGPERLLVYEFMSNTSLDKHLFGEKGNNLDWETRFNIILGTARGLAYLHEDSNIPILHRDIKAANILLDDKFNPKIADFGLAKFFPEGETQSYTRIGGTIGYTAPEYAVHGQLSEKADVYSYGVLVLEIVSGRKCVVQKLAFPLQLLLEWAWRQYQSEAALEIVDVRIREYPRDQMLRVITIALLCCQASPAVRPTMSAVVSLLTTASEIDVRPTQPAFIDTENTTSKASYAALNSTSASATDSAQSHGSITVSLFPR